MKSRTVIRHLGSILIVSIPLVVCTGQAAAQTDEPGIAQLMESLSGLETVRAEFVQETMGSAGQVQQSLDGELRLQRPDRLYWYTEPPYEQAIYADGETLWIHDIDLFQVTRQPLAGQFERSPALVFTGTEAQIDRRYDVSAERQSQTQVRYVLEPRTSDAMIRRLTLQFVGGVPEQLILVDSFDQTTQIRFTEVEMNVPIDASVFEFDPPDGVDVLEQMTR